ncbi:hypothetical protein [Streptomyces sp. NBC_01431]|uniref:hypothetical protein n=1 Tax=Streptomyces sp. NBC_01431 TaxID=2903863 RepID=UPI002E328B2E|nr:hypothetical protein [Streptomyces sp. NBC_01431]
MSKDVIEPGGIPMFTGNLEQLGKDAAALTKQAGEFRTGGSDVHQEFQGLSACYHAPEADQLFATTLAVKTKADDFADGLEKAAAALTAYESDVRPLVEKLKSLRAEAFTFTDSIEGDDHWRRDQKKVDHNERLMNDVAAAIAAFTAAERTCHDKITALVGGSKLTVDDGSHKDGMYGYSEDALKHAEETPWGGHAEREYTGLAWAWHQVKSFVWDGFIVDGIWGTVKGLGTLVGVDGWDKAGQAWTGLAKLATGLVITSTPLAGVFWTVPDKNMPSWLRDSRTAMKETGKALVAWDEWGKNPARAAGSVTFNVLTTVFTGGSGTAAKTGAVAKVLSVTGKVAKVVDPMTYVAKAGKFGIIKVGDLFGNLKNITFGASKTALPGLGHLDNISFADDTPVIKGNYVEWPGGSRLNLDDGKVYKPDGTLAPAHVELSADDIAKLKSSLPHAAESVPAGVKQPVLVGAGDRAGHVGDHPATPGTHTPGGTARDLGHGAANDLDRGATGGSRGGGPSTGDTAGHAADAGHGSTPGHGGHGPSSGGHDSTTGGHGSGSGGHGSGGGHDGSGGDAAHPDGHPSGHEPRQIDAAERKRLMDEHVRRANEDPAWREKYYNTLGHRKSVETLVDGVELPQLVEMPNGSWVPRHALPHGPSEFKFGKTALNLDSVDPRHLPNLDEAAKHRKLGVDLTNAQKAFDEAPSPKAQKDLAAAQLAYDKDLLGTPNNSKLSEKLGELAAELHVVPKEFPTADWIDLPKTPNGANMFDQLYKLDDNGKYLIVEAKAPSGELGWRKGSGTAANMMVKQGTKEYVHTILTEMWNRGGKDRDIADALFDALEDNKIDYVLVKAADNTGSYAGAVMEHFKI